MIKKILLLTTLFFASNMLAATHDYNIANDTGINFRADINNALLAIVSQNSNATAPSTTFAYEWWADTTSGLLKLRNAANSAWITVGTLASTNLGLFPNTGGTVTGDSVFSSTGSLQVSVGTTAQRSGSPANGMVRYNTDLAAFEIYAAGAWQSVKLGVLDASPTDFLNGSIAASVASNAMTVSIKDNGGSNPSATSPLLVSFRNATTTTGTFSQRSATSALSVVIPSTATLGTTSALESKINVWLIDNAGTIEVAVANLGALPTNGIVSTTAIAGASNSATTFYSTTARSNVAARLIGAVVSTQTTAGTWAASPSSIILKDSGVRFGPYIGEWASYTLTIGATTSAPTQGSGVTKTAFWRRIGDSMEIKFNYLQTGAGSAGVGNYLFPLPSGTIDSVKQTIATDGTNMVGDGWVSNTSNGKTATTTPAKIVAYNSTNLGMMGHAVSSTNLQNTMSWVGAADAFIDLSSTAVTYTLLAKVPIIGWFANDWQ